MSSERMQVATTFPPDTGGSTEEILGEVSAVDLPPPVTAIIDEYERLVGDRDRFLWKWIYSLLDAFTLSSVGPSYYERVRSQKTVFTVFITALDDLVEKRDDEATFSLARRLPYRSRPIEHDRDGVDRDALEFLTHVWGSLESELREAPRYDRFEDVFAFDLRQAFNAMEYTRLITENPSLANMAGAEHYGPHNMVLFAYTDIDLMYSPGFDPSDLAPLRCLTWDLQKLARIGNWLTTWERELYEGDYSAGIIVRALRRGVVSPDELDGATASELDRIATRIKRAGIEEEFLAEWREGYFDVLTRDLDAGTVELREFIRGMETVMEYHLASQGLK